jgi:short-subunit dehydrogenase
MNRSFYRDKAVLITGGSRGLGLEIARQVCQYGGRVGILARSPEELAEAKTELDRIGGETLTIQCDLFDGSQIQSAIQQMLQRFGRIDVLVNNAGIIEVGPIDHMKMADFDRAMRVHLWAPVILTMQVIPHLRANGGGRIVNISSIGGKMAVPHMVPYCTSKFALTGFSDSIRSEVARDKIYITTVTPGLMRTGSHVFAKFKGDHSAEYAWFSFASHTPIISISVERAAAKILNAARRGRSTLIYPWPAYLAIAGNAVFPNLTAFLMKLVNRCFPGRVNRTGDEAVPGAQVQHAD